DRAALVGQRPRHRLPNPPGGIRAELEASGVIELFHGAKQADTALLDEVAQWESVVEIAPRDAHYQAKICFDQGVAGKLPLPHGRMELIQRGGAGRDVNG